MSDLSHSHGTYRHAALLYEGEAGFLDGTVPFIRDGVAADEPTLVVLPKEKIELLRTVLGPDADRVQFADMQDVGANPARIIPAWQRFVEVHPDRDLRGIGEPIFPERSDVELRECQHHERLLNPALEGSRLYLLCPYDTGAMDADVIEEARRSHPLITEAGTDLESEEFVGPDGVAALLEEPLGAPPQHVEPLPPLSLSDLSAVRAFVRRQANIAGLSATRRADLVLAVNELVTNSVCHGNGDGNGRGNLRIWHEDDTVIVEVTGEGRIDDPLVDRRPPTSDSLGQRGLWLANQLCDLVQLRSLDNGVVARAHMRVP